MSQKSSILQVTHSVQLVQKSDTSLGLQTLHKLQSIHSGEAGMTRKRGTCVLVRLPPGDFPFPLFDVIASCNTLRGSFVGTREDMAETLAFAADVKTKADIELQPLTAINDVFDRLEHGKVAGRVVPDFMG
jgi:propanol-preferring alcohol dehydrogenase